MRLNGVYMKSKNEILLTAISLINALVLLIFMIITVFITNNAIKILYDIILLIQVIVTGILFVYKIRKNRGK